MILLCLQGNLFASFFFSLIIFSFLFDLVHCAYVLSFDCEIADDDEWTLQRIH